MDGAEIAVEPLRNVVGQFGSGNGAALEIGGVQDHQPRRVALGPVFDGEQPAVVLGGVRPLRRVPDGRADARRFVRARDAGADGFLLKPITARALTDKIEAATRRRRAFIDAPPMTLPGGTEHGCDSFHSVRAWPTCSARRRCAIARDAAALASRSRAISAIRSGEAA